MIEIKILHPKQKKMFEEINASSELLKIIAKKRNISSRTVKHFINRRLQDNEYITDDEERKILNEYRKCYLEYRIKIELKTGRN